MGARQPLEAVVGPGADLTGVVVRRAAFERVEHQREEADAHPLGCARFGLERGGLAPLGGDAGHPSHQAVEPQAAADVLEHLGREHALADQHLLQGGAFVVGEREAALDGPGRDAPRVAQERRQIAVAFRRTNVHHVPFAEQDVAAAHLDASVGAALG